MGESKKKHVTSIFSPQASLRGIKNAKQSQSFGKLRTGLPAFGRKLEMLNPKSETYGFSRKN
jgi:hypothetical protein